MKRSGELKRTGFARPAPIARAPSKAVQTSPKPSKTPDRRPKGLKTKQRAVTADEKALWNRLATEIGCVACMKDGQFNPYVSIHHVDGRTKPDCHKFVLPLCAPHHQHDDTDPAGRIGVHPWSARFEQRYGAQRDLVDLCMTILERAAK